MMKCFYYTSVIFTILNLVRSQEGVDLPAEEAPGIPCYRDDDGNEKVCVIENECENGFIDGNSLPRSYSSTKLCDGPNVCCTLKPWDPINADKCAIRSLNTYPQGPSPLDANFSEFPWQAMILRESTKSLLCGGVIIKKNFVLTSGDCVAGYKSIDVLTKGGEWKLGSDDEGKPFEIVRLRAIVLHPDFSFMKVAHNLALLHLERDYTFDVHIRPLCFDEADNLLEPIDQNLCIVTGWGQQALQIHQKNAIQHYTNLTVISSENCAEQLGTENFNSGESVCALSDSSACNFDFGSALACQLSKDSQEFVLKGIYTYNSGCYEPSTHGSSTPNLVFTKPDIEWINRVTNPKPNQFKYLLSFVGR